MCVPGSVNYSLAFNVHENRIAGFFLAQNDLCTSHSLCASVTGFLWTKMQEDGASAMAFNGWEVNTMLANRGCPQYTGPDPFILAHGARTREKY